MVASNFHVRLGLRVIAAHFDFVPADLIRRNPKALRKPLTASAIAHTARELRRAALGDFNPESRDGFIAVVARFRGDRSANIVSGISVEPVVIDLYFHVQENTHPCVLSQQPNTLSCVFILAPRKPLKMNENQKHPLPKNGISPPLTL